MDSDPRITSCLANMENSSASGGDLERGQLKKVRRDHLEARWGSDSTEGQARPAAFGRAPHLSGRTKPRAEAEADSGPLRRGFCLYDGRFGEGAARQVDQAEGNHASGATGGPPPRLGPVPPWDDSRQAVALRQDGLGGAPRA